jgi:hypothetical protein
MLNSYVVLFCLILSHFSFAQTNRMALPEEAFKGLPYFIYASMNALDEDAHYSNEIKTFTKQENIMFRTLLGTVLINHNKKYKLKLCGVIPCYYKNGERVDFNRKDGEATRMALTSPAMDEDIFINLKMLNDPETQIDFVDMIQILMHEVTNKLPDRDPNQDNNPADSFIQKITQILRDKYAVFQVSEKRKIHVLTLSHPLVFEQNGLEKMKSFYLAQQGFEVTTFDETNGSFYPIEEVRHQTRSPELVQPADFYQTLPRTSITGVEVDRFSDSTTIIRVAVNQSQMLLDSELSAADTGIFAEAREIVIRIPLNQKPLVSRRQGQIVQGQNPGILASFELKNSVIKGDGYLPYRYGDMKDLKLFLLVRTNRGLLNLPLIVYSKDPNGPIIFRIERKLAPESIGAELIATDIVVYKDAYTPLNRIFLKEAKKIEISQSQQKFKEFKLLDILTSRGGAKVSMRSANGEIEIGQNKLFLVFESGSKLQELTLYVKHKRKIYDPKSLDKKPTKIMTTAAIVTVPESQDQQMSTEFETEVVRIDARDMSQSLKDGILSVEVSLPIRESLPISTEEPDIFKSDFLDIKSNKSIPSQIFNGVDLEGIKSLSKIVAVNEAMQNVSLTTNEFSAVVARETRQASYLIKESNASRPPEISVPAKPIPKDCKTILKYSVKLSPSNN